jgi:hypothetical protein
MQVTIDGRTFEVTAALVPESNDLDPPGVGLKVMCSDGKE